MIDKNVRLALFSYCIGSSDIYKQMTTTFMNRWVGKNPKILTLGYNPFLTNVQDSVNLFFDSRDKIVRKIHDADVVYIPGGNTWGLKFALEYSNLFAYIRDLALSGKPFIGSSAGSIIFTPTVDIAAFADENRVEEYLPNHDGLNIVPFSIKPHYEVWQRKNDLFVEWSKEKHLDLACLYRSSCIAVENGEITVLGRCKFISGK